MPLARRSMVIHHTWDEIMDWIRILASQIESEGKPSGINASGQSTIPAMILANYLDIPFYSVSGPDTMFFNITASLGYNGKPKIACFYFEDDRGEYTRANAPEYFINQEEYDMQENRPLYTWPWEKK